MEPGSQLTSALNKIKLQVSAQEDWGTKYNVHIKGKEKKGWREKNAISILWRNWSKIVKFINEYKTKYIRRTWKGDRISNLQGNNTTANKNTSNYNNLWQDRLGFHSVLLPMTTSL